jgi:nicotinamidase-related amidase
MGRSVKSWLEPAKCTLLVVDMQNDYCSVHGYLATQKIDVTSAKEMVPRVAALVRAARDAGVLIAFSQQTSLPNGLSDSPANTFFRNKTRPGLGTYPLKGTWGHEICTDLGVVPGDLIIEKFRPSAFHGTSIDMVLKAQERGTVLVCGVATEGCVASTIRDVANRDYMPVIIVDCVASSKADLHEASLKVMMARYTALSSTKIAEYWAGENITSVA